MRLDHIIRSIESEWEAEEGFFWKIRQGNFLQEDFKRALERFVAVPSYVDQLVPARLVSLVWYVPIFMEWQRERVRKQGGDLVAYEDAMTKMTNEVQRILGAVRIVNQGTAP